MLSASIEYQTFHTSKQLFVKYTGNGIPVLAIHGIIGDSSFFDGYFEQMSSITDAFRLISYDRRGYGLSNQEQYNDYSVQAQAEDAAEILRMLGSVPAFILGNSAGSLIGLELTRRHPELVRGIVMLEPSLGYSEHSREILSAWNKELNEYKNAGRYKKALVAFTRITGDSGSGKAASGKSMDLKKLKQTYQNLNAFMDGELNEVQHYTPPIEELKSISQPIYVAVTEDGCDSIFAVSSKDAAEIIGWPVITFPGYHGTIEDHPAEAARITADLWAPN